MENTINNMPLVPQSFTVSYFKDGVAFPVVEYDGFDAEKACAAYETAINRLEAKLIYFHCNGEIINVKRKGNLKPAR